MEEQNEQIIELQQIGIELWRRAETWKAALSKIKRLTRDTSIIRLIDQTLSGDNT